MKSQGENWSEIEQTLDEIIIAQKRLLINYGRRIIPTLTPEDMLQPNDYPELENNPHFRYEEGVLCGIQMVQAALRAIRCCPAAHNPSQ